MQRTSRTCEVPDLSLSAGYDFITDTSCFTAAHTKPTDIVGDDDPALGALSANPVIGDLPDPRTGQSGARPDTSECLRGRPVRPISGG